MPDDDYREDEPWESDDPDEDRWGFYKGECGMDQAGHCGLAGSEWCEFECPFRR